MELFTTKFGASIKSVLSGFDRLVFRGTLRQLSHPAGLEGYLNWSGIRLKDFKQAVLRISVEVREAAIAKVREAGRPVMAISSPQISKLDLARQLVERDELREGPVALFTTVEPCQSFEVRFDPHTHNLSLLPARRKCLFLYRYDLHPRWGLMHVRLQSWFPFQVQIYINGREWLARQMDEIGLGYRRQENCFVDLENPQRAQSLARAQLRTPWAKLLDEALHQMHPVHAKRFGFYRYYWSLDESEFATDVMFHDPTLLQWWYPRWVDHGIRTFASPDVMRFLGHRVPATGVHGRFLGEVRSDVKRRPEGVRIKHRIDRNSLKMYDKHGLLRVETTLCQTRPFKVFRRLEGQPHSRPAWRRLRKGIADIARRADVSQAANVRYLEALASVDETTPLSDLTESLCRPVRGKGHCARPINPFAPEDRRWLQAISDGRFAIHGFRNRHLRELIYGADSSDPVVTRRRSAQVTRHLRLLRAHGLIHKISGSHSYRLSPRGRQITTALLHIQQTSLHAINRLAA